MKHIDGIKYLYIILIIVIIYLLLRTYTNLKQKNNIKIFLISHDNSNSGAPLYLYNLQQFFIKNDINTEFLLLNKYDDNNLIIQNGIKIDPTYIEEYIFSKCYVPIVICNTVVTYEYLMKLSHLNLNIFWVIHEWFDKNNYFTNIYDKIKQVENVNIIFPCEGAKNNNNKYFSLNNKQHVIPYGFDPDILLEKQNNSINFRKNIKLNNPIIISIIGTIEKRKNQQDFIDNVFNILQKKYNNLVLVLVGKEAEKLREDTNKNSIILTGLVNNPISYINESDIIVSHSLNEVLPINTIESMFCSKPIVSSNAGCSSHEVINNINGYIYNNNDECIKYLSILIENKQQRDLMGLKSNELFYKNFTTKNYNKFFEILNNNY